MEYHHQRVKYFDCYLLLFLIYQFWGEKEKEDQPHPALTVEMETLPPYPA